MQVATATASYDLATLILFLLLILNLIVNTYLYNANHESYSIKYRLLLDSSFMRTRPCLCVAVEALYKTFFVLPFLLLLAIAGIRAVTAPTEFVTIVLNGLIVLLTIYPTKDEWFYRSKFVIWLLVIGAQFDCLYQHVGPASIDTFSILSSIFYPINGILFCWAILAN